MRPDFLFRDRRTLVFVDGCFWHGCPVHAVSPKTNSTFWTAKIARNRARDRFVDTMTRKSGWKVIRVWEHSLRSGRIRATGRRLLRLLGPA